MNRTWGYTKRPKNWKDRLEQFYKELEELDNKDEIDKHKRQSPPVPERPPAVGKPTSRSTRVSLSGQSPTRAVNAKDSTIDSSFSH